jgi:hypothetical protein
MITDPIALFPKGLRRILQKANFYPVWCDDRPPVGQLCSLPQQILSLPIISTEIAEAIVQVAEVKRLYRTCRVVLPLNPLSQRQFAAALHYGTDTSLLGPAHARSL